jgi:hypothetical protein
VDMGTYVVEARYAVERVLDALWHEQDELQTLTTTLDHLTRVTGVEYARAQAIAMDAETPDDVMLASAREMDTYFGVDKQRHDVADARAALELRLEARKLSIGALGGSILQLGKQGLAVVHGGLGNVPPGRDVAPSAALSYVIWQGRNQAMHWDEGSLKPAGEVIFHALAKEFGSRFLDYNTRSLGFEVVEVLQWRNLTDFESAMMSVA